MNTIRGRLFALFAVVAVIGGVVGIGVRAAGVRAAERQPTGVIAYARGNEIRLIDAGGTNDRQLWSAALPQGGRGIRGLDWRPDGNAIAFASGYQPLCSYYDSDIYEVNASGSGLRRLTNSPSCQALAGFPKGTVKVTLANEVSNISLFLLYVEGAAEAVVVPLNPGQTKEVTVNNVADLGNFPQKVVVINGNTRWFDPTVTVNVQAGGAVSAGNPFIIKSQSNHYDFAGATNPSWRADGSRIAYVFYQGILETISGNPGVAEDSQLLTAVGSGATGLYVAWSPTKDELIYAGSDSINLIKPGATGPGTPLVDKQGVQLWLGLDWLPDGSGFVFAVSEGDIIQTRANIYKYTFAGPTLTNLTQHNTAWAGAPGVSPDGEWVAYEYASSETSPVELRVMRIDGTDKRSLGVSGNTPDWQPGRGPITIVDRLFLPFITHKPNPGPQQTPTPTKPPGSTATPQATATPKPTATATTPPQTQLANGNFEQGPDGSWTERVDNQVSDGALILEPGGAIPPRSGQYVAWLGGVDDQSNSISQQIKLGGAPVHLRFYYQIRSGETEGCDFDVAGVFINGALKKTYGLCADNETNGWQKGTLNLSSYAGQTVTISFLGEFDESVLSSFFIDDVSLAAAP